VAQGVFHHTLGNGLTLLAERMEHVRSAALNFLIPAGCVYDPPRVTGIGSVLAEMITRGAGERDSRELTLTLDNLGVDRDESVGSLHTRFWGATLARNLPAALEIYADIVRRPHLPERELEAVKALALQDLKGLEDEPRHKLLLELRRQHYPAPLGADRRGTPEGIANISAKAIKTQYRKLFQPRGAILSVAGNIDWKPLRERVEELFGDWEPGDPLSLKVGSRPKPRTHLPKDTTQTQIGIAYQSVPIGHPDYYAALGAVNVLSGGMSARLFTEVREKRGLCYAVWASYETYKDRATVVCYAGSTNDRAQETLDVTLGELRRLGDGVEAEEVERVQAGLKSSLIMQEESTSARARTLSSDWYYLGRVRSFDEIAAAVNALTPDQIVSHLRRHPPKDFTIVTLGPRALALHDRDGKASANGANKKKQTV
jgi:predicted Zn-dependent peptidase